MFTGIITGIGHIESIQDAGDRTFRIGCDWDCSIIDIGASIACSGVCLTLVARHASSFDVTASAETLAVTTAEGWSVGDQINLERALKLGDELGGHMVSGHVDGLAEITLIENSGDSHVVWLKAPPETLLARIGGTKSRPLLNNDNPLATLTKLSKERAKHYQKAQIEIDTDGLSTRNAMMALLRALDTHLTKH